MPLFLLTHTTPWLHPWSTTLTAFCASMKYDPSSQRFVLHTVLWSSPTIVPILAALSANAFVQIHCCYSFCTTCRMGKVMLEGALGGVHHAGIIVTVKVTSN